MVLNCLWKSKLEIFKFKNQSHDRTEAVIKNQKKKVKIEIKGSIWNQELENTGHQSEGPFSSSHANLLTIEL
jgi:hypothetical protein